MKESIDKDLVIKELRLSNKSLNRRIGILERTSCQIDKHYDNNSIVIQKYKVEINNLNSLIKEYKSSDIGMLNAELCKLKKDIESWRCEVQIKDNQLIYSNAIRDEVIKDKIYLTKKLQEHLDHKSCWDRYSSALSELEKENQFLRDKLKARKVITCRSILKSIRV